MTTTTAPAAAPDRAPSTAAISLRGLHKRYGTVRALDGL
ncbi:MAG: ABC transporter ATP-binding protein, partial [Actinomycetales bacterium]|nr:ABC transporter ATP-binding protein [Actinomycetales bacterium]